MSLAPDPVPLFLRGQHPGGASASYSVRARSNGDGPVEREGTMDHLRRKHRRLFAVAASAFVAMTTLAPAAAWADMIVKPGH